MHRYVSNHVSWGGVEQISPSTRVHLGSNCNKATGPPSEKLALQAKKDNENVYYQRPPRELPALAEPRRLVTPAALTLPPAAPSVLELRSIDAFAASAPPEATVSRGAEGLVPVPVAAGVPGPSPVGAPQGEKSLPGALASLHACAVIIAPDLWGKKTSLLAQLHGLAKS